MLGTTIVVFAMMAFFVLFLVRNAYQMADGRGTTVVSACAWVALLSGLYLAL